MAKDQQTPAKTINHGRHRACTGCSAAGDMTLTSNVRFLLFRRHHHHRSPHQHVGAPSFLPPPAAVPIPSTRSSSLPATPQLSRVCTMQRDIRLGVGAQGARFVVRPLGRSGTSGNRNRTVSQRKRRDQWPRWPIAGDRVAPLWWAELHALKLLSEAGSLL